ncbi:MAG: hypothetical protein JSR81_12300 [Proteobacteria bacterium]|nr:hypothetical protein [Pseudomonadota bacterium]
MTISFAGSVEIALRTIRRLRREVSNGWKYEQILECLRSNTMEGECDFIVSSHMQGPEIRILKEGRLSEPVDFGWLGDFSPIPLMQNVPVPQEAGFGVKFPQWSSPEERQFIYSFRSVFGGRVRLSDAVGGLPIVQVSSPFGHCYQNAASSYISSMKIGPVPDPVEIAAKESEQREYRVNFIASAERGAAVMATYFAQIGVAYLYSPLEDDEPAKLLDISMEQTSELVGQKARELGGTIVQTPP